MKIILLGLSGSGKSTVGKLISEKYNLKLYEADGEVENINGGIWPTSDEIITKGFQIANKNALKSDNIIYVISWLSKSEIEEFYGSGFKIFEMHASFEELSKRKIKRDNETPDRIEKFKDTYIEYFNTILNQEMRKYYELSIDTTNLDSDEIFKIIKKQMDVLI